MAWRCCKGVVTGGAAVLLAIPAALAVAVQNGATALLQVSGVFTGAARLYCVVAHGL